LRSSAFGKYEVSRRSEKSDIRGAMLRNGCTPFNGAIANLRIKCRPCETRRVGRRRDIQNGILERGRKYGNGRRCLTLCVNIDVILAQYRCRSADRPIGRRNGANIERKQRSLFAHGEGLI